MNLLPVPGALCTFTTETSRYELSLNFENQPLQNGKLMVAIFADAESFLSDDKAFYKAAVDSDQLLDGSFKVTLPEGNYAVAVFLDLNGNGKLDSNIFRYPTEPYGFSNNPKSTFGPPPFKDAAFSINTNKELSIRLG
jgi:uncharacterized protein (DUF2141 family)